MKKWLADLFKDYFVVYFPLVVIFTASLYIPSDSDLGWHLKYGEYFFKNHQVLRENIFSSMMAGYPWINSSWVTDLLTYTVFNRFGFMGLTILGAIVITGIFYFFSQAFKLTFWERALMFPLIFFFEEPLFDVSFRGQLISLLFIGVLFYLFKKFSSGKNKLLLLTIPLFILWSNLHGEFIFGLGLFLSWTVLFLIQKIYFSARGNEKDKVTKATKFLFAVVFLSLLATIVNPFGYGVYQEALKHFGNPQQKYIIEWIPFELYSVLWWKLVFWTSLIIVSLTIIIIQNKFMENLQYIGITLLLTIFSFYVRRYTWPMLLVSIPIVRITFETIKPKWSEISDTIAALSLTFVYLYIIIIKAPKENIGFMNWNRFCTQYVGCSPAAAEYLTNFPPKGKLMTFYNWGGWLIWNYPQVKPSIDGRMHLWEDEKGYSAFKEYYPYEQNWIDIDKSDYDTILMSPKKPVFYRLKELVKMGKWEVAYEDNYAAVFTRKIIR